MIGDRAVITRGIVSLFLTDDGYIIEPNVWIIPARCHIYADQLTIERLFFINKITYNVMHTVVLVSVKTWCNIKYTYWFPIVITWMNNWHNTRYNHKANYHILPIVCHKQYWIIYVPDFYISELRVNLLDCRLIFTTSSTQGNSRPSASCDSESNLACITYQIIIYIMHNDQGPCYQTD